MDSNQVVYLKCQIFKSNRHERNNIDYTPSKNRETKLRRTMKKLYLLILSVLIASIVTTNANEIKESKAPTNESIKTIAGSYIVSKSYLLTKAIHGEDGVLQVLQDSRLPKDAYDKQVGTAFTDMNMIDEKLFPQFKDNPPLGSVLRILSKDEKFFWIRESHTYDLVPVAWLEEVMLSGSGRPSYLFTQDLSIGMGSYAGPTTYFYNIVDGKLKPIEYLDEETGKREQIVLTRSLKTNWKLVKSKDGKSNDILYIACRPNFENKSKNEVEFVVYYDRFHFDGTKWVRYEKVEKDFWETEGEDLPPLSKFPTGP
jgi:hypothetical protein